MLPAQEHSLSAPQPPPPDGHRPTLGDGDRFRKGTVPATLRGMDPERSRAAAGLALTRDLGLGDVGRGASPMEVERNRPCTNDCMGRFVSVPEMIIY